MKREVEVVTCYSCAKQVTDGRYIEPEHLDGEFQCYPCTQKDFEAYNARCAAAAEQRKAVADFDALLKKQRLEVLTWYLN